MIEEQIPSKTSVKIKICGLTALSDIDAVNREKPEYIGFVFAGSRRQVTPRQALELRERLAPGILAAGVFVNEEIKNILSLVRQGIIDVIQLHGAEDEASIHRLKALTDKPVIKAVSMTQAGGPWRRPETAADYLLLDSPGGGTGRPFDWNMIGNAASPLPGAISRVPGKTPAPRKVPLFLAGGLTPGNVAEAVSRVHPFAVDVSSGVETDGRKDPVKIKEFIRRVRNE